MQGSAVSVASRRRFAFCVAAIVFGYMASPAVAQPSAERGAYIFHAAGCLACHSDPKQGAPLAGGPALKTPFGTFYAPNITPDPVHGIGGWSDADFLRAMRDGASPNGRYYYQVFPFTAYTKAAESDLLDLKAYLLAQPPVAQSSRPHDVSFPFSLRILLMPWRWLNFTAGAWRSDPAKSPAWNRGGYLVEALGHCGECHTSRNWIGGLDRGRWLAGSHDGPPDETAPNLTPDEATGIGPWSEADIADTLEFGMNPDGEPLGNSMAEVVRHSTSRLNAADRNAIATYLKGLPPLPSAVKR